VYDYRKYQILYVDDEEQSLKYFRKAFQEDFSILTSPNVREAEEILDRQSDRIGILITDQRMPGRTGVDLLGHARRLQPRIVRMLTTAYSDLDSAIGAVNSGAIFKYIVKPWNLQDLRGCLLRGMEFFLVQLERDTLLKEKMSILQRLIIMDRVRSLAIMAAGLSHQIRNPLTALKTFLDLAPKKLREELQENVKLKSPEFWEGFWSIAEQESGRILKIIDRVGEMVVMPVSRFTGPYPLSELVRGARAYAEENTSGSVEVDILETLPPVRADVQMVERLFQILLRRMIEMTPGRKIRMEIREMVPIWGAEGIRIRILSKGPEWTESRVASLFTAFSITNEDLRDPGLDLLPAFFIIHHHGGEILIHKSPPEGPGLEVVLPLDPGGVDLPFKEDDLLQKILAYSEDWQSI
jgi:two-component system probable response regulator PhcQ